MEELYTIAFEAAGIVQNIPALGDAVRGYSFPIVPEHVRLFPLKSRARVRYVMYFDYQQ